MEKQEKTGPQYHGSREEGVSLAWAERIMEDFLEEVTFVKV